LTGIYEEIIKMKNSGQEGVLITVIDKKGHGSSVIGRKLLYSSHGVRIGTVGGGELESLAIKKAKQLLEEKKHALQSYDLTGESCTQTDFEVHMVCGGNVTLFYEFIYANPCVYIFGGGHVGRCLINLLKNLDYNIILIDNHLGTEKITGVDRVLTGSYTDILNSEKPHDRSYVVIAGYSHDEDYEVLCSIYKDGWRPKYIGLLASYKKVKVILSKLIKELGTNLDFSRLYAPIGLDIGGDSPEEIAIAIASEIQVVRYQKTKYRHLSQKWFVSLLER
jgi:xanthine dehydrogenase accessory factor